METRAVRERWVWFECQKYSGARALAGTRTDRSPVEASAERKTTLLSHPQQSKGSTREKPEHFPALAEPMLSPHLPAELSARAMVLLPLQETRTVRWPVELSAHRKTEKSFRLPENPAAIRLLEEWEPCPEFLGPRLLLPPMTRQSPADRSRSTVPVVKMGPTPAYSEMLRT